MDDATCDGEADAPRPSIAPATPVAPAQPAAPAAPVQSDPGWPIVRQPAGAAGWRHTLASLRSRGALSWYVGAGISLIWLVSSVQAVAQASPSAMSAGVGIALVVLYGVAFLLSGPVTWSLPARGRPAVSAVLLALSLTLVPWLGWEVSANWTYVGVSLGIAALPWRRTWPMLVGLGVVALGFEVVGNGGWSNDLLWLPAVVVSISMMMAAFAQTQATLGRLRASQHQVEQLAAERERSRVARDIHDILGHSLTVVTVKAELAGRLVDVDPARAKAEIGEVEALARGALADVRATVAGFRGVNVSGELAAARAALDAAGIEARLPGSTDAVPAERRELAGWVVREGVTNVVRHSGASVCRVRIGAGEIEVADDGVGPSPAAATSTGLAGLRERVEAAGGRITVGRSDLGGFSLRASL